MKIDTILIVANLVIFVIAPFLPNAVYDYFVDTYLGAIILMVVALYTASFGYLSLLSAFVGIASLFAESHARKVKKIKRQGKIEKKGEFVKQLDPPSPLMENEIHPEIPEAEASESVTFMPKEDDGSNAFKAIDTTINTKVPLNTTSSSTNAEKIYVNSGLAEKLD